MPLALCTCATCMRITAPMHQNATCTVYLRHKHAHHSTNALFEAMQHSRPSSRCPACTNAPVHHLPRGSLESLEHAHRQPSMRPLAPMHHLCNSSVHSLH
eukprot:1148713-Pelagomonas_calceolata.AAC.1